MLMLFISSVGGSDTQTMVNLPTAPEARLVIAAIGEAGEGKSTLLNLILNSPGGGEGGGDGGKVFFDVSDEPEACTTSPTYRSEQEIIHFRIKFPSIHFTLKRDLIRDVFKVEKKCGTFQNNAISLKIWLYIQH